MDTREVAIVKVICQGRSLWQLGYTTHGGQWVPRDFEGLSETLNPGESPLAAAVRGLFEECRLTVGGSRLMPHGRQQEVKVSASTGRETLYRKHCFSLGISPEEAAQIPLQIEEGKGTLVLEWREVSRGVG